MVLDTRDIEDSAGAFRFPVSTHKKNCCAFEKIISEIGPIWSFLRFETTVVDMIHKLVFKVTRGIIAAQTYLNCPKRPLQCQGARIHIWSWSPLVEVSDF